ncbi:nucleoside 2-deoxyribosyltransferase [Ketogulonicigenium vulgare]|nr:nucleoside 2-deoxyribosyltransferase [Ketogulonicigenium vulgare]ADO41340.1 nucleoside 2-deoxyribosyltransferase protein [Ketogulonicigenium vulgare Y25]AOZ55116.1 nucleoside 2-deoxyribosyltransferase protein [Ketogulonicigenium vulgare]
MSHIRKKVYIAGPDVFFRNASEVMRKKGEIALEYGFDPSTLAEDDLDPVGKTARQFGISIGLANERKMDEADFIIANLTPFRGISADVGTAFEVGYMRAQGKPVFAYTNTDRDYFTRLSADYYAGAQPEVIDGVARGADGLMIENHDMVDNLMLDTAAEESGGAFVVGAVAADADLLGDLQAFRDCLAAARAYWDARTS